MARTISTRVESEFELDLICSQSYQNHYILTEHQERHQVSR